MAHRFYQEFVPQARERAEGKADVQAVIEEVMAAPEHAWTKGLDPKVREALRDFY